MELQTANEQRIHLKLNNEGNPLIANNNRVNHNLLPPRANTRLAQLVILNSFLSKSEAAMVRRMEGREKK